MRLFRGLAVLVAVVALMLGGARAMEAAASWCEEDPIIHFADGRKVHVAVAVPRDRLHQVKGPVKIKITLPKLAPVVWIEPLYSGYFHEELEVEYLHDKVWDPTKENDVKVQIIVKSDHHFNVRATAWGDSRKPKLSEGVTNWAFNIKQTLAP